MNKKLEKKKEKWGNLFHENIKYKSRFLSHLYFFGLKIFNFCQRNRMYSN